MMMQCLRAGGMEIAYDPACDWQADIQADDGYHPNADGLFEFSIQTMMQPGFPGPEFDGKAIKIFPPPWGPLTHIPVHDYSVVWIHRDPQARRESFKRFCERHSTALADVPELALLRDMAADTAFRWMATRADVKLYVVDYEAILADPKRELKTLSDWPIDIRKAAKVPDRSRRRF